MKVLKAEQVKAVDAYTIENEPIHSINLMERAARGCTERIVACYPKTLKIKVFAGPGNNGGDALAIARQLADLEYNVQVFIISEKLSPDSAKNYDRLIKQNKATLYFVNSISELPDLKEDELVIEGLFGSGLTRPLEGFAANVVEHINNSPAQILSIDIPSGFFAEDNSPLRQMPQNAFNGNENSYDNAIKAHHTLTLQMPFLSFFFPDAQEHVGKWEVVPIGLHPKAIQQSESKLFALTPDDIRQRLLPRPKFSHKGIYGHGLLVSGSYGKMGAAILGARACLRSGLGLLTVHVPKFGYEIIQTAVPEAMISIDRFDKVISEVPKIYNYQAIGIGPGIGKSNATQSALSDLLEALPYGTMVFDADALNLLAENRALLAKVPPNSILTPHPKEFERLAGESENYYQQFLLQKQFAAKHNLIVVLKGAHTGIALPDGSYFFNTTGNPGMATGGSGDVLTGIILSLLAQNYPPADAAIIGVFIHGKAADIAACQTGKHALLPSDIINALGSAFRQYEI